MLQSVYSVFNSDQGGLIAVTVSAQLFSPEMRLLCCSPYFLRCHVSHAGLASDGNKTAGKQKLNHVRAVFKLSARSLTELFGTVDDQSGQPFLEVKACAEPQVSVAAGNA